MIPDRSSPLRFRVRVKNILALSNWSSAPWPSDKSSARDLPRSFWSCTSARLSLETASLVATLEASICWVSSWMWRRWSSWNSTEAPNSRRSEPTSDEAASTVDGVSSRTEAVGATASEDAESTGRFPAAVLRRSEAAAAVSDVPPPRVAPASPRPGRERWVRVPEANRDDNG